MDGTSNLVRIPPELDVPLTPRVRALVDTAEFRRLARISQLGLVSLVYPAAHHTRFEHSLGVYRLALLFLRKLSYDPRFAAAVTPTDAELLIVAALLHDLGHWPFCHPIEDMRLPGVPSHELFANSFLLEGDIADTLRDEWQINPRDVVDLLSNKPRRTISRILTSILSGPIDIDKMDYLARDSLHAGVPYGRNFDQNRLIGSLCLNEAGDALAITEKGKTAAEMLVFARYVMFSEVYWHHGVRSATAMLQRAFYLLHGTLELDSLFRLTEAEMIAALAAVRRRRAGRRTSRRPVWAGAPALQAGGPIQLFRGTAALRAAGAAAVSVAGRLRAAVCHAGQHVAGADRGPARGDLRRSTHPARGRIQHRRLLTQGSPLSAAGRRFAGRASSGPAAIRRLCETGPRFCRPARRGRSALARPIARSAERGHRPHGIAGCDRRIVYGRRQTAWQQRDRNAILLLIGHDRSFGRSDSRANRQQLFLHSKRLPPLGRHKSRSRCRRVPRRGSAYCRAGRPE